jgi:hypothetical protein
MSEVKNIPEQVTPTPAERVRNDWKALVDKFSYKGIVNNVPFLAFIAMLCVVYITNSHRVIDIQRQLNTNNRKIKELQWRYMDVKSKLMAIEMEKQVIKNSAAIGLKPLTLPAYKVTIDTTKPKE